MEFKREEFESDLYETSKSSDGKALMGAKEKEIRVYHFDRVKEWFCENYRNNQLLRSCDAYYQDDRNYFVIEFKNTHHFKIKPYMEEIEEKILDTHMLLAETFWKNRKTSKIAENVKVLLIYHDALDYGEGVIKIAASLNKMKPIKGDRKRRTHEEQFYNNEEEYQTAKEKLIDRYKSAFYKEIEFMDKTDFDELYTDYFKKLS